MASVIPAATVAATVRDGAATPSGIIVGRVLAVCLRKRVVGASLRPRPIAAPDLERDAARRLFDP